jgi:LmbE family N-acetylglucosaminyl deacetylase
VDAVLSPATLQSVAPETLTGAAPILVLAPHPDDESLGCGGLLAHAFAHHGAHVVCMTDGSSSHPGSRDWPPTRLAAERQREFISAVKALGGRAQDLTWLGHPDGWLGAQDHDPIIAILAGLCRTKGMRHLFAPAPEDHHEDHKSTARIARRMAEATPGLTLFTYPVWSRWDNPDLLSRVAHHAPVALDTTPWRTAKRAAIAAHASQLGQLVRDDPAGFTMSPAFVDAFIGQPEIFWRAVR